MWGPRKSTGSEFHWLASDPGQDPSPAPGYSFLFCNTKWADPCHAGLLWATEQRVGPHSASLSRCGRTLIPSSFPHWTIRKGQYLSFYGEGSIHRIKTEGLWFYHRVLDGAMLIQHPWQDRINEHCHLWFKVFGTCTLSSNLFTHSASVSRPYSSNLLKQGKGKLLAKISEKFWGKIYLQAWLDLGAPTMSCKYVSCLNTFDVTFYSRQYFHSC